MLIEMLIYLLNVRNGETRKSKQKKIKTHTDTQTHKISAFHSDRMSYTQCFVFVSEFDEC